MKKLFIDDVIEVTVRNKREEILVGVVENMVENCKKYCSKHEIKTRYIPLIDGLLFSLYCLEATDKIYDCFDIKFFDDNRNDFI